MSNLFLVNLGIKAKKKRLGGGGGGGGGLPPITPYTILGKAHYSAGTNSGLTQPNCSFSMNNLTSGSIIQDVNSNNIANYEVRDYITGTLRGIAADSYPFGITPNLNITLANTARNIDMSLDAEVGLYNPTGVNIGTVDYTMSVVVDTHNLVAQGFIASVPAQTQGSSQPVFHSSFAGAPIELMFAQFPGGQGIPHGIASGELVFQITATVLTKAGNTALTTGNPANAAETTKQSFYLDFIVQ